ncbi:hypothetical protein V8B97DRAFT_1872904 [Scleroderma yunnanense]
MNVSAMARQPVREVWPLECLVYERSVSLGLALHPSTHRAYSSHLNSYLTFCRLHGFPIALTPDTLSFYVVFMSHYIQPRSVDNYLSGIVSQLEPHFPEVRAVRNSNLVQRTLRGSLRHFSRPVVRRQPLSRMHLLHALNSFPRPFAFDNLCWLAQLLCGFFGLLRLGELVSAPSDDTFAQLSSRSSVRFDASFFSFVVPRQKSDLFHEGTMVRIVSSPLADDPHTLFLQYLAYRDASFPLHPLLWIRADRSLPTHAWFLARFRTVFPDPSLGGHSLRSGGATSLAAAGVPPSQIQAIGAWSSLAWQRYVRKHPVLLQTLLFHGRPLHDPPFAFL